VTTKVIFLTTTGLNTWTVPSDWNNANNTIECIGGGGSGGAASGSRCSASGGAGGGYGKISNVTLTPGASVSYGVGAGGAAVSATSAGNAGGDTWFNAASYAAAIVGGAGGVAGQAVSGSGTAASATGGSGKGATAHNGGSSGSATTFSVNQKSASGGGGAAGPNGDGTSSSAASGGSVTDGGSGDAGSGGAGGVGSVGGNGTEYSSSPAYGSGGGGGGNKATSAYAGGTYGAGGGANSSGNSSGAGSQGLIVITYDAITSITVNLTGVAAAPAAGSLTVRNAVSVGPSGVAASPAAGTLSAKGGARYTPSGVAASPTAGSLTATGGARQSLTGVSASPAAGTLSAKLWVTLTLSSVSASPAVGSLTATGGASAALTGVSASPAVGSLTATGGVRLNLASVAASPAVGRIGTVGVLDLTFIKSPARAGQYLIEISAYQGSNFSSGGIETIGELALSSLPIGSGVEAGPVALSYADRDWIGEPTDSLKPHTFYEGRAISPLTMEAQAPLYPENERRVQRQFGLVELINTDGVFDQLAQALSVDGRPVTVRLGPYMGSYSDFTIIAQMLGTAWQLGENTISIAVQDQAYTLDLPIQGNLYSGDGGADGTADIAGKPKPICYGEVVNITPAFVDPLNLIYQVHDGEIESVSAVYDRGGVITLDTSVGTGGDVASYSALVSASVGASKFATCLAEGLFKLGSSPAGVITADVKGDKSGGVYTDTLDGIALRIFEDRSNIDPTLIDTASFADTAALAGKIGVYVSTQDAPTSAQVVSRLIGSVGGWWGAAIDGKVRAGRIRDPRYTEPEFYLDRFDVILIAPEQKPIPRWRQRVAYAPNYTIQRGEDLDVTVTDARRQFLTEPYSVVTKSSSTLPVRHPMAIDPPVLETLLASQSDAQAIADSLQELFGTEREILRVTVKRIGLIINLGACVNLTYPRFSLNAGRNFIVIGRTVDADKQEVELRLWG